MFGAPPRLLTSAVVGIKSDAQAIIDAMAPTPNATRQGLITAMVDSLSPVWPKIGVLFVFAAHSQQAGLINWKNPSGLPALATASPVFTTDRGFNGDGAAAFVDTRIPYLTAPGVSRDNAHAGVYAACGGAANGVFMGQVASGTMNVIRSTGNLTTRMNETTGLTAGAFSSTAGTHLCMSRSSSTGYERYIDGVASTAAVIASVAISTGNLCALRQNSAFAAALISVRAIHVGAALSAGEVAVVRSAIQTYMAAIGAS